MIMTRRTLVRLLYAIAFVGAVAIYFTYDPAKPGSWFPRCPFTLLTGLKCPGCGSQRALHALLHGDVAGAWHYNAGLIVAIPLVALFGLSEWKRTTWPRFYMKVNHPAVIISLFVIIIAWWIGRNLAGW